MKEYPPRQKMDWVGDGGRSDFGKIEKTLQISVWIIQSLASSRRGM